MMATLWFCIAAVMIAAYVLLDGFDLGAGIVQLFVRQNEPKKALVMKAIGPVWDGNEVWLIAGGGTIFFAFPALYASSFSGFYLALMIVLWLLILRGISIEFQGHLPGALWQPFWNAIFGLSSATLALVFGVALGNVIRGVPLDQSGYFFLPLWTNFLPGAQAGIIDWYTLLVGLTSFFALAVHGSLWLALKTSEDFQARARTFGARCWIAVLVLTALTSIASFSLQPNLAEQFRNHSWGVIFPAMGAAGLIATRAFMAQANDLSAFLASSAYLLGMLTSAAFGIFPNVLPSNTTPSLSLTVYTAATTDHGLIIGLYWFIPGMLLALGYTVFVYRHFSGKVA